jgi:hypothetical protein
VNNTPLFGPPGKPFGYPPLEYDGGIRGISWYDDEGDTFRPMYNETDQYILLHANNQLCRFTTTDLGEFNHVHKPTIHKSVGLGTNQGSGAFNDMDDSWRLNEFYTTLNKFRLTNPNIWPLQSLFPRNSDTHSGVVFGKSTLIYIVQGYVPNFASYPLYYHDDDNPLQTFRISPLDPQVGVVIQEDDPDDATYALVGSGSYTEAKTRFLDMLERTHAHVHVYFCYDENDFEGISPFLLYKNYRLASEGDVIGVPTDNAFLWSRMKLWWTNYFTMDGVTIHSTELNPGYGITDFADILDPMVEE